MLWCTGAFMKLCFVDALPRPIWDHCLHDWCVARWCVAICLCLAPPHVACARMPAQL